VVRRRAFTPRARLASSHPEHEHDHG
jgi:hypothetical protein